MSYNLNMADAQQSAHAFLVAQATTIEAEVYRHRYPQIRYPSLIPVDMSANPWTPSVTYFSIDAVGQADWFNAQADDVPNADIIRDKHQTTVSMAAIGYSYDLEELNHAQLVGINLTAEKGIAARQAAEEFLDSKALFGDETKGFVGLTNAPGVTAGDAAATGSGSSTAFADKTPDQILADFNATLTGIFTSTNTIALADTVLLPYTQMHDIGTRRLNDQTETTVLDWIKRNNVYTMETGQELTIRGVRGLETAGQGGSARMIAYRRSIEVLKMHYPMPFRFLPVWQTGPMRFDVPGFFRFGGVDIRLPDEVRYVDGI